MTKTSLKPNRNTTKYIHRYITDEEAGHPVMPQLHGWSPQFMSCELCGRQIIDQALAAAKQVDENPEG